MTGPLAGLKVIEMAGIGPGPFAGMVLADLGADVVRIARPGPAVPKEDVLARSRTVVTEDLRQSDAVARVLDLVESADALIEGYRPGVMERLGLGPEVCLRRNPRLVYGRMTGWGQNGPLARAAGHDINYIALTGALHAIGRAGEKPVPPLNYVGDFGGGGMMLVVGVLAAVLAARSSGDGQVIDAAMTDGAALLSSMMHGFRADGRWTNLRGENILDGGAFFYDTYACADGRYIAIGAIEPQFYALLCERCGLADDLAFTPQMDRSKWLLRKERLTALFLTQARDHWCTLLEGTDACFAPVLDWDEAPRHPHNVERGTYVEVEGVVQAAPAPRFSGTPTAIPWRPLECTAQAVAMRWRALR